MANLKNTSKLVLILIAVISFTGCATKKNPDPFEPVNRAVYVFNNTFDTFVFKPVAKVYNAFLPQMIRNRVGDFFQNIHEIPHIANDLLQGKFSQAAHDTARFSINTTWGLLGLFDIAGRYGLERNKEDFGQTLGAWGYETSAYLVLPFLGPSTVRDAFGIFVDGYVTPTTYFKPRYRNAMYATEFVHQRAEFLEIEKVASAAGVDKYVLLRNGYLQRRLYLIRDGQNGDGADDEFLGEPPE